MGDSEPEPPIGQPHGEPESGVSESEGLIPGRFSSGETCRLQRDRPIVVTRGTGQADLQPGFVVISPFGYVAVGLSAVRAEGVHGAGPVPIGTGEYVVGREFRESSARGGVDDESIGQTVRRAGRWTPAWRR